MKYFTPDLFVRAQGPDPAMMDGADAEWEAAEARYEQRLRELGPVIEPTLRRLEGVLLHDAAVTSISRRGDQFVVVLLKDIPPRDVVTLTYTLTGEPTIDQNALPPQQRSGVMQYLYDEFDAAPDESGTHLTHSILFSNGWEINLPLRDLDVSLTGAVYPLPGAGPALVPMRTGTKSA